MADCVSSERFLRLEEVDATEIPASPTSLEIDGAVSIVGVVAVVDFDFPVDLE